MMTWKSPKTYTYKPLGAYGEVEKLYRQKVQEKEDELDKMRKKKEQEEVLKKYEETKKLLEQEAKKREEKARKEKIKQNLEYEKAKKERAKQEKLKLDLHTKLFESFYGSEDEILKNKKTEIKYLFIFQIEDEDLVTEELTANEIEERLDKFALSRNNYVIVANGKVVDFPLNNNLKP